MSFAMTVQGPNSVMPSLEIVHNGQATISLADQAFTTTKANGSVQSLAYAINRMRVIVYLKTLVVGANTGAVAGPIFYVEGADNVGMSTNLTIVSQMEQAVNVASATEPQCIVLNVMTPVAAKQFFRVVADPTLMGVGSSGTYDAVFFPL